MAVLLVLLMLGALAGAIVCAVRKQMTSAGVLGAAFVILFIVHVAVTHWSHGTSASQQQGNFPIPLSTSMNAQPK